MTAPASDIGFLGKDQHETFQFYLRQHWIRMLWPTVRTLLLTLLIGTVAAWAFLIVGIESPEGRITLAIVLALCLLSIQLWFLIRFYGYFLHVFVVTDRRVHRIKRTLLTHDEHESIDLWVLQDIRAKQRGPVQNVLGFGTITLEAQETSMRLHFVPRIHERSRDLLRLLEQARSARSQT